MSEVLPKHSKDKIENFVLTGYKPFTNPKGRGVSMFVREGWEVQRLTELEDIFSPSVFCKISSPGSNEYIIVGTVYRSPNSGQEDNGKIIKLFDHIFASFKNRVVVSGDFNYPDIDWQKETCSKSDDHPATKFLDCIQQNYITQLNLEPTHYRGLQTPNILDLLFTNAEEIVSNLEHWPPLGKSHHPALYFEVQVRIKHSSGHSVKFQPDKIR